MEPNNYNSVHILSEAVIMGGISMYFYKKISELESTIEDLKGQIVMQNNQLRYLLTLSGSNHPQTLQSNSKQHTRNTTPLKMPVQNLKQQNGHPNHIQKENFSNGSVRPNYALEQQQRQPLNFKDQLPPSSIQEVVSPNLENNSSQGPKGPKDSNIICEGGVCKLVLPKKKMVDQNPNSEQSEKKVAISKISKQIEFDRENMDLDQTSRVNTFTKFSPNPVLKSVTPKPSESGDGGETDLEKILNDIDDE